MPKYDYKFKKEVVEAYLRGDGGRNYLADKYGIPSSQLIIQWIKKYESDGDEGLMRSRKNENYTFEFKLRIVQLYLTSEISYQELAVQEGIRNPTQVCNWVNRFQAAGPEALRSHKKGRKRTMNETDSQKTSKPLEGSSIDTSAEHVQELEDELLKLRIENAFLKELRRLRLEDEAKTRDLPESSTASEDNSN